MTCTKLETRKLDDIINKHCYNIFSSYLLEHDNRVFMVLHEYIYPLVNDNELDFEFNSIHFTSYFLYSYNYTNKPTTDLNIQLSLLIY